MGFSSAKTCENPELGNVHTNARFCSRVCYFTSGGRPRFHSTDEERRIVRAMVAYWVPLDNVAKFFQIDKNTLAKVAEVSNA